MSNRNWHRMFCSETCAESYSADRVHGLVHDTILDCDESHAHDGNCPALAWEMAALKYGFCAYCSATLPAEEESSLPKRPPTSAEASLPYPCIDWQ